MAVNCGALPRELVESELFGYSSGAFTGARREGQAGKFEAAQGGTVFLDEIDSMPMEVQAKLLRVIETGEVVRLGNARPIALDVAIMAASGLDARRRVEEGAFRLDLFHRLSVVEIVMPPLRDRRGDIPLLTAVFLDRECAASGREPLAVSREATAILAGYAWPGNIRELQNLCARWAITVTGSEVHPADLPAHVRGAAAPGPGALRESLRGEGRHDHSPDPARDRWPRGRSGPAALHQQDHDLPSDETVARAGRQLQCAMTSGGLLSHAPAGRRPRPRAASGRPCPCLRRNSLFIKPVGPYRSRRRRSLTRARREVTEQREGGRNVAVGNPAGGCLTAADGGRHLPGSEAVPFVTASY